MALSIGSQNSVSLLLTIQATGLLTFALVGLLPTEHACLRWTHQHAVELAIEDLGIVPASSNLLHFAYEEDLDVYGNPKQLPHFPPQ